MGNPDHPTPPHIVAKLIEAAQKPANHRYSVSSGIYKLRLAICDWYRRRYGVELDPDREAIVTIGSKEGIGHLALAILGPGDVVLCPTPDVSDPPVLGDHRRRRSALGAAGAGRGLLREPGRGDAADLAEAQAADHQLPAQPDHRGRRPRVLRAHRRVRARARHAGGARPRLRRPRVRRLQAAELPAGARARRTSASSSSRSRRATTCRAGASASRSATAR